MPCGTVGLCGISSRFQLLSPSLRQVPHVLLTRSPLSCFLFHPKTSEKVAPFDLHVLGAPPAFVLSQDQTLYKMVSKPDYSEFKSLYSSKRNRLRPLNYLFFGIFLELQQLQKGFLSSFDIVQFSRSCCTPRFWGSSFIISH